MKPRLFLLTLILLPVIYSCGVDQSELNRIKKERDTLAAQVEADQAVIQVLRDSLTMLAFPADQRLTKINSLVTAGDYTMAKKEIAQLTTLFPESKEAKSTPAIIERIDKLIAQKAAEEEGEEGVQ